jgi:hypothetical protein
VLKPRVNQPCQSGDKNQRFGEPSLHHDTVTVREDLITFVSRDGQPRGSEFESR